MEKETLKNIMRFLENEENKTSFKWKLLNDEPFTEEELNIKGNLDLDDTKIRTLPKGLKVWTTLYIRNTPLEKFSDEELKEMVYPGFIKGKISR